LLEKSDFRIYNYDDKNLRNHYSSLSRGVWITTSFDKSNFIHCDYWIDEQAYIVERGKKLFKLEHFSLKGMHNLQNLLLVIAAARKVGLSGKKIKDSLSNYKQLPHRMETIYKNNDLEIINDSKATNGESASAALKSYQNIHWIAGGLEKKDGLGKAVKHLQKVEAIYLFGRSQKRFYKQIKERLILAEEDNKKALEILKRELKIQLIEQNRIKESEIQTLESKLKIADEKKTNALNDLKNQATNKINSLNNELVKLKDEIKNQSLISELSLKNKVSEAVNNLEKENSSLTNSIEKMKLEYSINEKLIEEKFKSKISERDLTIQELREMKSRLSTKMVGETLEIHCETQFNLNRSTAFKNSFFEKDNDVSSGSKGDYIFREFDENNLEIVSIMFEMKNESLNGTNKRKNEDFLKELDKDRRQKSCEYAVLVSLLEPESELYNSGIVDVSHRFPKMYVIRPQFF